jgi:hypothetical protein
MKILFLLLIFILSIYANSSEEEKSVKTTDKSFTMNEKRFEIFKKAVPIIIDQGTTMAKGISNCLSKEISEKNLNSCMNDVNKTTEEIIFAFLPEKISTLSTKDKNNKMKFVWTKEKHQILITELNNKIKEFLENKKCLLETDTMEQYVGCLKEKNIN